MAQAIPSGCEGFIPHLVLSDASAAIEFYKKAFGAEEISRMPAPDGRKLWHAEMRIGTRIFFLSDDFPEMCGGKSRSPKALGASPVTIHMYVENVDKVFQRAVDAGATATMPPTDMFWGDRYANLVDPMGHTWGVATHIKDLTPEQMMQAAAEMAGQCQ
ncbi:MAG: VOC family protein [Leptolyngbya sp. PLA3]|nr:MAG: VOC family protein [Cyanobacteria bacterium CYA]MCE7968756.1 VOC family protein [Leptolyngbya sp. PL-A3]